MEQPAFNKKQEQVFDQLKTFVNGNTNDTFILNGYAGTGKTYLIQHFARYLKENNILFSLLATTGRAAAVLRGKTNLDVRTVHGELYFFSKVDGDHEELSEAASPDDFGQMKLVFEPRPPDSSTRIYIIDEASMLGSEIGPDTSFASFGSGMLLPDLLGAIGKNKIIFVGDPCQLPPIAQKTSPALSQKWLTDFRRKVEVGTLDTIMRTSHDNDILTIAASVRKQIGKPKSASWTKLQALNRNNCSIYDHANSLFLEYFSRFLQYGPDDCIAISRSNNSCNKINKSIRSRLFPDSTSVIHIGEILIISQNNHLVPLTNGDFVKIIKIGDTHNLATLTFADVRVKQLTTDKEFSIKLALDPLLHKSPNLRADQQRNLMISFSKRMRQKGIKPNSEAYHESMKSDPFLNSLRASYGYAVTCHKAQGGEWDNVYLFLDKGMYGSMDNDQLLRWWYTAITRTKKQLHLHLEWWIN